ncbi:MAG TPA: YfhO family protein [Candidatus Polarisedimenticolaceae bacterium]|nr:YfhO family protein [Candidatus Polarisedimenticolaceae bacterium]
MSRGPLRGPVVLLLSTLALFAPILAGGSLYYSDVHQTFEPARRMLDASLRHGSILWSPSLGNGAPLLASPIQQVLYPPVLLLSRIPPHRALSFLAIAHLLSGALGTWLLARRQGRKAAGAFGAAATFGFSGIAVSSTSLVNIQWSTSWIPWILLAADRAAEPRPSARWFAPILFLGPVVLLALLVGEPLGPVSGLLLALVLTLPGDRPSLFRRISSLALGFGAGLLAAMPYLLAVYRYLAASVRKAGFTEAGMAVWSFRPVEALGFLIPDPFGNPVLVGAGGFFAKLLHPEMGHQFFPGVYVGGLALALAFRGALASDRRRWGLLVALAFLLVAALGRFTPLHALLVEVPGYGSFRYPAKWLAVAMLPLALLVGRGVDLLDEDGAEPGGRGRSLLAGLGSLAVLGILSVAALHGLDAAIASYAGLPTPARLVETIRSGLLGGALRSAIPVLLVIVLLIAKRPLPSRPRLGLAAAALLALDLGLANRHLAPTAEASFYERVPDAALALRRDPGPQGRVYVAKSDYEDLWFSPPFTHTREFFRWERELLQAYTPVSYGFDLAFNGDTEACAPLDYAKLGVLAGSAPPRELLMLLGAAGVTHVVSLQPIEHRAATPVASLANRSTRLLRIYRNRLALPRARMVPRLTPYSGDLGFIETLRAAPDGLFGGTALVERSLMPPSTGEALHAPRPGRVDILEDRGDRIELRTSTAWAGWLVLSDAWVPGWTARVDGREVPILKADYAFRAVAVPAGAHQVVLRYSPW